MSASISLFGKFEYSLSMLAFIPFGGSVVIFRHLCKIEMGNCGWGFVESQSLNLSSTSFLFISKFYNIFSRSFKKFKDK